jgi:hypothetical protein
MHRIGEDLGLEYGRKRNAIQQFAFQNKREIAHRRAELLVGLKAACDGRLQYPGQHP